MSEANPLDLVKSLRDTLEAYLPTTLPVSRRYPLLAEEFRALLKKQPLVKGPYVEALPDFEKGRELEKLLAKNGGCLNDGLAGLPDSWLERKLHQHQDLAIESASKHGENLVVATGTGSGKTECFLLPIANMLLNIDRSAPSRWTPTSGVSAVTNSRFRKTTRMT